MKKLLSLLLAVILILPMEGGTNVANYLYNGVELPDINTVWTDKETYPYACIAVMGAGTAYETPMLMLKTKEYTATDAGVFYTVAGTGGAEYVLEAGASGWSLAGTNDSYNEGELHSSITPVWTSYDVKKADGTVFFAASEPVPVGNDHVKYLSGDGMALYNGVMLPNINTVWTDKETYPYAFVVESTMAAGVFELFCCSEPFVWDGEGVNASGVLISSYAWTSSVSSWQVIVENVEWDQTYVTPLVWSSYDFLNTDGTVYLAASDPIPLDGMNVITWDGDTTGLESVADIFYRLSDAITEEQARAAVIAGQNASSLDWSYPVDVVAYSGLISVLESTDGAVDVMVITDVEAANNTFTELLGVSPGFEQTGIYAQHDGVCYPTLFAYPASSGGLDFSNTELNIFDPNVTANSADFAVDWTGLPVTTANHVHYFISGELDDGTEAANSPVYLFSSSAAADGEHELIFQDLEPGTEYTVTARLLYNTTGDRSDFTDSGVEATFDFTTLADGGFDRNSFLLGLASGLGKTAAMKADADHNAWAQGYVVGKALWEML